MTSQAANLGYEIPALLYSLLKPTRTLIAKAIGRELESGADVVELCVEFVFNRCQLAVLDLFFVLDRQFVAVDCTFYCVSFDCARSNPFRTIQLGIV